MNQPLTTKRLVGMIIILSVFVALVNLDIIPSGDDLFPELYEELGNWQIHKNVKLIVTTLELKIIGKDGIKDLTEDNNCICTWITKHPTRKINRRRFIVGCPIHTQIEHFTESV